MKYIEELIKTKKIKKITEDKDITPKGNTTLIWVNRKLGLFYFSMTRSPISTFINIRKRRSLNTSSISVASLTSLNICMSLAVTS